MKTETLRERAYQAMEWHLADDPHATLTELAENAAVYCDHDEWLDDSSHWVWEMAIQAYERNHV